jgi:hypothetical protein
MLLRRFGARMIRIHVSCGGEAVGAALGVDEVTVGLVAWLNQHVLHADDRVLSTAPAGGERLAPFVCCHVSGDRSGWAAITSRPKPQRLELKSEWRSGGSDDWRRRAQYLNDGNNILEGPTAAFVDASTDERTVPADRARLSSDGVAAILNEIHRQAHRRLVGTENIGHGWSLPDVGPAD